MNRPNNCRDAHTAKVVLRVIGNRSQGNRNSVRDQIVHMTLSLDEVILKLPEDPPDDMVAELERIVTALRTADQSLLAEQIPAALSSLELARQRLDRFVKTIDEA